NVVPTIVMVTALYLTLERQPMQLKLLREGDWAGIATMAIGLSAFQTVLEEGNKDDWFASPFILRLAIVALVSLSLFIWIELTVEKPLIRLRHHRGDAARLRTVRIGLYPAGLSRPDAGLQCRADRRRAGVDRPAAIV